VIEALRLLQRLAEVDVSIFVDGVEEKCAAAFRLMAL
jgi:hypothetical protein